MTTLKTLLPLALMGALLTGTAHADTTLTFRYNDPDPETIEAAIAAYEAANPDITIELERISWSDARTQFLREAAVGTGPDIVHIAFVWPQEMGSAGALVPLNDLIASKGAGAGFDDFIAGELATGPGGEIYALPWTADTWTLVYSPSVLADIGVAVPTTWDELKTASKAAADAGKVGLGFPAGSGASNSIWFLVNYYLWSNGHALVVEDGNGGYKLGVDEATLSAAFTFFTEFMDAGGNPESNIAYGGLADIGTLAPMVEGNQAFSIMPPNVTKELIAATQARNGNDAVVFASTKLPDGLNVGTSHMGGRMLGINANTEHQDEAYAFIQFLISGEFFSDFLTAQFPASKSALAQVEFAKGLEGFAQQLPNARTWGAYANSLTPIGTMWSETGREFGAILVGDKTADQAAAGLLATIQGMLDG